MPKMANKYFQFRQFTVHQEHCAMKVGTDGTLLGAWAHGGRSVLDIGTGTGLVSLMMAQRFPEAHVVGIDIDSDAVVQARENAAASPFNNIDIVEADANSYSPSTFKLPHSTYEAIVSNPPYFVDSMESSDNQRTIARHATTLSYHGLIAAVKRLLDEDGELSVVIPFDYKALMESEAALGGLFKVRECSIKTTPRKPPRRYLLAFRKHPVELELTEGIIETAPNVRSPWYYELTKEFYLR